MRIAAAIVIALVATTVAPRSGATPRAVDRTCAAMTAKSHRVAVPGGAQWVWPIPHGCAWLAFPTRGAECPVSDCTSVPDLRLRFRAHAYRFALPTGRFSPSARGLSNITGDRLFAVAAGRATYTRAAQALVTVSAREYDGRLASGPNAGYPDIGPRHTWVLRIQLGLARAQLIGLEEAPDR